MKEQVLEQLFSDVLIVGSGAAGLRAAISAREKNSEVCIRGPEARGKQVWDFLKRSDQQ